ncbi:MAG TPA: oxygenase MpaB family protein [Mycobacterium sp.]|nr:oxygenase MpaB family protein [Mycobacterium sp.]
MPILSNPLSTVFDAAFDQMVRSRFFKGLDFAGPRGDQGWFGPDSAVWYVHSHMPLVALGLFSSATMEQLDPSTISAGYHHSRAVKRGRDGNPRFAIDPEGGAVRFGHSLAFFLGVAYGPTETAEKCARIVRAMHGTIHGVSALTGTPYDADDPELLRWNYANVVWGLATAHERYHYAPLRGADLDRYYQEFTRVGYALGGTDLPASKAEVMEVLDEWAPRLALLPAVSQAIWPNNRHAIPLWQWPSQALLNWTLRDMQPRWARNLYMHTRPDPVTLWSMRQSLKVMLNSLHVLPGPLPEFRQAKARVSGVPLRPIRFDPERIAAQSNLNRDAVERLAEAVD